MRHLFTTAAVAALLVAAGSAQATGIGGAFSSASASGSSGTVTSTNHAGTVGISDSGGFADASVIHHPAPGVTAHSGIDEGAGEGDLSTAYVGLASISYNWHISPGQDFGEVITVPLTLFGHVFLDSDSSGDARAKITIEEASLPGAIGENGIHFDVTNYRCNSQSHSGCGFTPVALAFQATQDATGFFGNMTLAVSAKSFEFPDSATAEIDPTIVIDPEFLRLHPGTGIDFSEGIGNGEAVGGVPEPATWALMIAGFGLAGASLRRRRAAVA